jgi:hypothetical protein
MDGITEQQFMAYEDAITRYIFELYNFRTEELILDYTNYYSYIVTSNLKSILTKRGHNRKKQYNFLG